MPTWDKVILYGAKIISGDIIKGNGSIFKSAYKIPFNETKKIKIKLIRSKGLFLVKSLLNIGRPIGLNLYGNNGKFLVATEGNVDTSLRIIPAGTPNYIDIPIFEINEIVYGKHVS